MLADAGGGYCCAVSVQCWGAVGRAGSAGPFTPVLRTGEGTPPRPPTPKAKEVPGPWRQQKAPLRSRTRCPPALWAWAASEFPSISAKCMVRPCDSQAGRRGLEATVLTGSPAPPASPTCSQGFQHSLESSDPPSVPVPSCKMSAARGARKSWQDARLCAPPPCNELPVPLPTQRGCPSPMAVLSPPVPSSCHLSVQPEPLFQEFNL